ASSPRRLAAELRPEADVATPEPPGAASGPLVGPQPLIARVLVVVDVRLIVLRLGPLAQAVRRRPQPPGRPLQALADSEPLIRAAAGLGREQLRGLVERLAELDGEAPDLLGGGRPRRAPGLVLRRLGKRWQLAGCPGAAQAPQAGRAERPHRDPVVAAALERARGEQ